MTRLGVGIIGLGVGESLADAFARHPDCSVAALCDLDPARLAEIATRHAGARTYRSAEALIDDPAVNVVVVASYDDAHAPQILRALAAGRHVFAEKPLCLEETDAIAIRAALRKAPALRLCSNTLLRKSPRFQALKAEIGDGRFGKLYFAEADYNYGRLAKLTDGWRGSIASYSVMLGGGIHLVDLLQWLLGAVPTEVQGYGNALCSREAGSRFPGNDLSVALLRFADGTIAKVGANFGCVSPHFHRLVVYGTKATFENALPDGLRYVSRDPATPPERFSSVYPGVGKGDLVPGFVDAILGRGSPSVTEQDVFAALSTCFAIDKAVATGRPQQVRDLWSITGAAA